MPDTVPAMSPLDGLLELGRYPAGGAAPGVTLRALSGVTQFQVIARRDMVATLGRKIAALLDRKSALRPLEGAEKNGLLICAPGPREFWVFAAARSPSAIERRLAESLEDSASLFDQSHGRCLLRLSGPRTGDLLARGSPLDLDAAVFPATGACHGTIHHIPVTIVKRTKPRCLDISVPVSYAGSFARWLTEAAVDFGYTVA